VHADLIRARAPHAIGVVVLPGRIAKPNAQPGSDDSEDVKGTELEQSIEAPLALYLICSLVHADKEEK